jgi:hypothetical protein
VPPAPAGQAGKEARHRLWSCLAGESRAELLASEDRMRLSNDVNRSSSGLTAILLTFTPDRTLTHIEPRSELRYTPACATAYTMGEFEAPGRHGARGLPDQEDLRGRPSGLRLRRPHARCVLCYRSAHDRSYPPPPRERALQGEGSRRTASSAGRPCPRFPLILGPALTHARHPAGRGVRGPQDTPRPANAPPYPSFCRFPSAFPNENAYKLFRLLNEGDLQV